MAIQTFDKHYEDTELVKTIIQTNNMFYSANAEKPTGIQVSTSAIIECLPFLVAHLDEALANLYFNVPNLFRAKIAGYQISSAFDLKQGEYHLEFKHKDN